MSILQPKAGQVIEIYTPCRHFHFLTGYCRSLSQVNGYAYFCGGFRRCSNPTMTMVWAEHAKWGAVRLEQLSIEIVPEQPWMRNSTFIPNS